MKWASPHADCGAVQWRVSWTSSYIWVKSLYKQTNLMNELNMAFVVEVYHHEYCSWTLLIINLQEHQWRTISEFTNVPRVDVKRKTHLQHTKFPLKDSWDTTCEIEQTAFYFLADVPLVTTVTLPLNQMLDDPQEKSRDTTSYNRMPHTCYLHVFITRSTTTMNLIVEVTTSLINITSQW